jgi:hypothetical protein
MFVCSQKCYIFMIWKPQHGVPNQILHGTGRSLWTLQKRYEGNTRVKNSACTEGKCRSLTAKSLFCIFQIHIRNSPYSSFSCCPRARRCISPAQPSKVVSKIHAFCSPVMMVSDTRGATCTSGTIAVTRTTSACVRWRCLHTGVRTYAFCFSLSMVCAQYYAQCSVARLRHDDVMRTAVLLCEVTRGTCRTPLGHDHVL